MMLRYFNFISNYGDQVKGGEIDFKTSSGDCFVLVSGQWVGAGI